MALYLSRFAYEPKVWAALIRNPENRRDAVRLTIEAAGGQLVDIWYSLGKEDGYILFESPSDVAAASFLVTTAASGNLRAMETTRLMTADEMVAALDAATALPYQGPRGEIR